MRQFRDWRHTKGAVEPPQEYVDYILCHHVYHCTPEELDRQPAMSTRLHLEFWQEERAAQGKTKRVMKGRRKRRGEYERT